MVSLSFVGTPKGFCSGNPVSTFQYFCHSCFWRPTLNQFALLGVVFFFRIKTLLLSPDLLELLSLLSCQSI